jgi:hypothetical protein
MSFKLDTATERLRVNRLGGNDSVSARASVGAHTLSAGAGLDIVDIRDNTPDAADGGAGSDSVVADRADLDTVAGFETLERTPDATAPAGRHASAGRHLDAPADHQGRHGEGE